MHLNRITVEIWLWLGEELSPGFESPTKMRSVGQEKVENGTSIGDLLEKLAREYPAIEQRIFDIKERRLRNTVFLTYNNRVINPHTVLDQVLQDDDKITIIPAYIGG